MPEKVHYTSQHPAMSTAAYNKKLSNCLSALMVALRSSNPPAPMRGGVDISLGPEPARRVTPC